VAPSALSSPLVVTRETKKVAEFYFKKIILKFFFVIFLFAFSEFGRTTALEQLHRRLQTSRSGGGGVSIVWRRTAAAVGSRSADRE
jgi:hypothetical protein